MEEQIDPAAAALRQRRKIRQAVLRTQNKNRNDEEYDDEENGQSNKSNKIPPAITKKLLLASQYQSSSLLAKFYLILAVVVFIIFVVIFLLVFARSEAEENLMSVGGIMRALGLWSSGSGSGSGSGSTNTRHENSIIVNNKNEGGELEKTQIKIVSAYPPTISYKHDLQDLNKQMGLITKENHHVVKAIKRGIILRNMLLGSNHRKRRQRQKKEKIDVQLSILDEEEQLSFLHDHGRECMIPSSFSLFDDSNELMLKSPLSSSHVQIFTRKLWLWCALYSGYADGYVDHATTLLTEEEWIERLMIDGKNIAVVVKDSKSLSLIQKLLRKNQQGDGMNEDYFDTSGGDKGDDDDVKNHDLPFIHPSLLFFSPSRRHQQNSPNHQNGSITNKMMKFLIEQIVENFGQGRPWSSEPFYLERKLYEFIIFEQQQHQSQRAENNDAIDEGGWILLEGHCFPDRDNNGDSADDADEEIEYNSDGSIKYNKRLARHCSSSGSSLVGKEYNGFCCDIIM